MAALFRMLESFLLIGIGTFMVTLANSSSYWQLLNPKYSWLTGLTGTVLSVVGIVCFFNRDRQRKISELLGLAIFLGLAWYAVTSFEYVGEDDYSLESSGSFSGEFQADVEPVISYDGVDYTKINVAELLANESEIPVGNPYAVQGLVIRSDELDRAGYIAVGRLLIVCCFADSVAVVTLVKVDDPEEYKADSWVRVLGVISDKLPVLEHKLTIKGALSSVISDTYVLQGVDVEERPVKGMPFIFDVQTESPFSY